MKIIFFLFFLIYNSCSKENLGNTRADVERLKMLFNRIGVSSLNVISGLRRELAAMRSIIENQSSSFHAETVELVQKASEGLEERLNIYKNQLGQTKLVIYNNIS